MSAISRLWQREEPPAHKIQIPIEEEGPLEFIARAHALFRDPQCQIYIDTSFLMWMTKIGKPARTELIGWLQSTCAGRYWVPVWAAHEYQRHHGQLTIQENLDELRGRLAAAGRSIYRDLRPYLDELLDETAGDTATQQAQAIAALNEIERLSGTLSRWKQRYKEHAEQVIAFINDRVASNSSVFDYVADIRQVGENRYTNRIPPGFQDRGKMDATDNAQAAAGNKSGKSDKTAPELTGHGSNKWGDLIFWKEVTELTRKAGAQKIIVITNDEKNDWQTAGRLEVDADDEDVGSRKRRWKVPVTHPMLVYEAAHVAGATDVLLMSSSYLGGMLLKHEPDAAKSFVDVALVPSDPKGPTAKEQRRQQEQQVLVARDAAAAAAAEEAGYLFPEPTDLAVSTASIRRALLQSDAPTDTSSELYNFIQQCATAWVGDSNLVDILVESQLAGRTTAQLVTLARELHDLSLTQAPGSPEPLADLTSRLGKFPPKAAACLYAGMLASMYFEPHSRSTRVPPASPVADQLFAVLDSPIASDAVAVIDMRLGNNNSERRPLFVPGRDSDVPVTPSFADVDGQLQLSGLIVNGSSVFNPNQLNANLNLSSRFGGSVATTEDVVKLACRIYGIAWNKVVREESWALPIAFSPTDGFLAPAEVMQERATTPGGGEE